MKGLNRELVVSLSVTINANPSEVWNVLTNPELIKEYLYGTETLTDWKVGSEIVFKGEFEGNTYRDHGVILENTKEEKLSYSYFSAFSGLEDNPTNYSEITYDLELIDKGKTKVTWTQKGYASEVNQKHSQKAIEELLVKIKNIAEE